MDEPRTDPPSAAPRVSVERLRERTDELELLISGLSLFGLITLPDLLVEVYQANFARFSVPMLAVSAIAIPMLTAMAYSLAAFLIVHLSIRAYWVGLIGLRSVYPDGIRWESPSLGPVQRDRLRARTPDAESAVARADAWASTVFALFVLCALVLAVLGFWLSVVFLAFAALGSMLASTNLLLNTGVNLTIGLVVGAVGTLWLVDGLLARRFPRLLLLPGVRRLVGGLSAISATLFAHRLLGPVRLPLQTHLRRRVFLPVLAIVFFGLPWIGLRAVQGNVQFDRFDTQTYVRGSQISDGFNSAHYEDQRTPADRQRILPLVPSAITDHPWVPLFLPYFAARDDLLLAHRCPASAGAPPNLGTGETDDRTSTADARDAAIRRSADVAARCLATLWELRLDGRPVPLDGFVVAQRNDLGLRGLWGMVDLRGVGPGLHRLEVIWRPAPEQDPPVDDFMPGRNRHVIPVLWTGGDRPP